MTDVEQKLDTTSDFFQASKDDNQFNKAVEHAASKILEIRKASTKRHPSIRKLSDKLVAGTISNFDAAILVCLIKYFKPNYIFEVGTWIGTSSLVMAEAISESYRDGFIYTCDVNRYFDIQSKPEHITYINDISSEAIDTLPSDIKIDFVFLDGSIDFKTAKKLGSRLHSKSVIATHDFAKPAAKGILNFIYIQILCLFKYQFVLPSDFFKNFGIETSVCLLVRPNTAKHFAMQSSSRFRNLTLTLGYIMHVIRVKSILKIKKTFT